MPDEPPINRRNFFRQGLREMFKPIAKAAEPLERVIHQIGRMDDDAVVVETPTVSAPIATTVNPLAPVLRPPGALPEQAFRDACSRCGDCVRVCPAQCIKIDGSGLRGAGVPFIDVDAMPCVLCDGLLCMHACPTGALVPTPLGDIDMGTAVWHEPTCLRTHGQACTICVDDCPVGEVAIRLDGNRIQVLDDGCTGCGVCDNHCPTRPRSITVTPRPQAGPMPRSRGR